MYSACAVAQNLNNEPLSHRDSKKWSNIVREFFAVKIFFVVHKYKVQNLFNMQLLIASFF